MGLKKIISVGDFGKGTAKRVKEIGKVAPNIISHKDPRLLIWFTNGEKCLGKLPIPSGDGELNYFESLKSRCLKAERSKTPIIFAYAGNLLSEDQKGALEELAYNPEFKSLLCIDFNQFIKECLSSGSINDSDYRLIYKCKEKIERSMEGFKRGESNGYMNHSSIAYIVDASRMLMINYCDQMKVQLQAKYASVELKQDLFSGEGMVYLDFDVSYKGTEIVDISLPDEMDGIIFSTSFTPKKLCDESSLVRLDIDQYPGNEINQDYVPIFEEKYLTDGLAYQRFQQIVSIVNHLRERSNGNLKNGDLREKLIHAIKMIHESNLENIAFIIDYEVGAVFNEFLIDFAALFKTEEGCVDMLAKLLYFDEANSSEKQIEAVENSLIGVSMPRHPIINIALKTFSQMLWGKEELYKSDGIYDIFQTVVARFYAFKFALGGGNFQYKWLNERFIEEGFDYEYSYNFGNVKRTPFNAVKVILENGYFGHHIDRHRTWTKRRGLEYTINSDFMKLK